VFSPKEVPPVPPQVLDYLRLVEDLRVSVLMQRRLELNTPKTNTPPPINQMYSDLFKLMARAEKRARHEGDVGKLLRMQEQAAMAAALHIGYHEVSQRYESTRFVLRSPDGTEAEVTHHTKEFKKLITEAERILKKIAGLAFVKAVREWMRLYVRGTARHGASKSLEHMPSSATELAYLVKSFLALSEDSKRKLREIESAKIPTGTARELARQLEDGFSPEGEPHKWGGVHEDAGFVIDQLMPMRILDDATQPYKAQALLHTRRCPSPIGHGLRYINRWCIDKNVFALPARRPVRVAVLVDVSGSMSWTEEILTGLITMPVRMTVATYSADYKQGTLRIVAKNGRVSPEPTKRNGKQNFVDARALQWLAEQPADVRIWVSDGLVTTYSPSGERLSVAHARLCEQIMQRAGIVWTNPDSYERGHAEVVDAVRDIIVHRKRSNYVERVNLTQMVTLYAYT